MPSDPLLPLRFLLLVFGGMVNREQAKVLDYLREENRVLREQLGKRRLRLSDDQRARLARSRTSASAPESHRQVQPIHRTGDLVPRSVAVAGAGGDAG